MSRQISLAVIPGDGIGPEVIVQALRVLDAVTIGSDVTITRTEFSLGAARYLATGDTLTDEDLAAIAGHDAILLGAVGGQPGDPRLKDANIERGMLLKLRFALDQYVNLRPSQLFPGVASPLASPGEIDFVVVREGTEGPYVGNGGVIRQGTPNEIATEVSLNTAFGARRVIEAAFQAAQERERKHLTLVHKTNVLVHAGGLWQRTFDEVAEQYPDVQTGYSHVDAAMIYLVNDPSRFDVIVTDNLFGDIVTDLAAAVTGGIGLAASGNIDATRTNPSMFEPVHGSAPDIAGKNLADPTAAILSASMLLEHMGQKELAAKVENAVAADLAARDRTNAGSTTEIGDRIAALVSGS